MGQEVKRILLTRGEMLGRRMFECRLRAAITFVKAQKAAGVSVKKFNAVINGEHDVRADVFLAVVYGVNAKLVFTETEESSVIIKNEIADPGSDTALEALGNVIQVGRARLKLSQKRLAQLSGLSLFMLRKVELGQRPVELSKILMLLRVLRLEMTVISRTN
jgi:hypothetical protein